MVQLSHTLPTLVLACLVSLSSAAKNPKRGIAFAEGDHPGDLVKANSSSSVISWIYDWSSSPKDYLVQSNIPFVPLQWGTNGVEDFIANVKKTGSKVALGFNEPDNQGQSNLTAQQAANLWKKYIDPLKSSGVRLGAPAITNAPTGRPWLANFLTACSTCQIDFIAIHWYGTGIGSFYDYLWQVHGQFPTYKIWVTEYASTSTDDAEVADFIKSSATYMDTLDWIERYSWYAFFRQESNSHYNLLDANGNLDTLGTDYITQ